ncbi:hypothetical protein GCM10011367_13480 [Marinicauda pacifica]|jgi:23S rRNA pseudouridine2605 synthase|uniref:Pseudouridine synthase n=1 Tax=Marinicauda pacifica TaxID=1133559 RepID=A0A4S2HAX0_9PROT|nr:pseudouridine synthase [Marinicauda pacifica]TGY92781.1 rRNA pseudouridine synthase [Marinicauda pacifica]GGE40322.1 hypothetical protein GCM10011367_13480 [Marinicauda pacifica]
MTDQDDGAKATGERIAKYLAHAGIASRREAEKLIEAGRIAVNGKVLTTPAFKVTAADDITLDGEPVGAKPETRLWRHHKPEGRLTTHKDPEGRETVFEHLPKSMGRVISIGRLDLNSEGLLLLTNDGELARILELPATAWTRRYRVRAYGDVKDSQLEKLKDGITVEGVTYGPIEASVDRRTGANIWLTVGLREGKNREVRKVLNALGLQVNRLMRVAYGPFQLGALAKGETEEVKLSVLRDQLGKLYPLDTDGYPAGSGHVTGPVKTGTAKAKPRPQRPGGGSGPGRKPGGKRPGAPGRGPDSSSGKPAGGKANANRRRRP